MAEQPPDRGPAAKPAPTVLLVEDDVALLQEIGEYLGRHGFVVTTAGSAREARDRLDGLQRPDVVLCDQRLGDGLGIDLYRAYGDRSGRWVLMSGDPDDPVIAAAQAERPGGAACSIAAKPLSLRKLMATLREPG